MLTCRVFYTATLPVWTFENHCLFDFKAEGGVSFCRTSMFCAGNVTTSEGQCASYLQQQLLHITYKHAEVCVTHAQVQQQDHLNWLRWLAISVIWRNKCRIFLAISFFLTYVFHARMKTAWRLHRFPANGPARHCLPTARAVLATIVSKHKANLLAIVWALMILAVSMLALLIMLLLRCV